MAVIEGIAQRRGFRIRGGDADFEKASTVLLQDYRSGVLGRVTLETPETRKAMLDRAGKVKEGSAGEKVGKEARTQD